ncbi:MAG TPA: hypothetical protein VG942_03010, partial [Hyphomonadaceae bacterium]|nr:hypothetical protein [Hyphomonadaceae bacterium]
MSEASAGSVIIDRIYALLPAIDSDVDGLRGRFSTADKVDVFQAAAIFDAVELLIGFGYRNRLGLSANDLAKFEAIKGQVSAGVLMKVGVRAKALLRELEGEVARDERQPRPDLPHPTTGSPPSPAANLSIRAVGWVALNRSDNAALIADIARL